ncbi:hypothetical protein [Altererythrobacter sp. MTPC7]|uniref:hypothetical protein n=1 Tax=Altererythrobacter sp. MTPC7 TaxID=3056567 RepID=UPI0036F1EBC9
MRQPVSNSPAAAGRQMAAPLPPSPSAKPAGRAFSGGSNLFPLQDTPMVRQAHASRREADDG